MTVNDDKGEPVCLNQYVVFIVGAGRFGGKKSSPHLKVCINVHVKGAYPKLLCSLRSFLVK